MTAPAQRPVIDLPDVVPMDPLPFAAVVFGVIGLLDNLFAPLAVMAAVCSLWPLCRRPGLDRGRVWAVVGLTLGCVGTVVLLATH